MTQEARRGEGTFFQTKFAQGEGPQERQPDQRPGKVRKASPQPEDPPSANNLAGSQGSKAEGVAKMPRPTEQQKLRVRVQNSWSPRAMVLFLQTKERETKVPEEVTVQAVGEGLRAKPTAPYKGSGSKSMFASLARKTETFKDSRRPGMPSKTSSSNVSSKS